MSELEIEIEQRASETFQAVVGLPVEERAAFLERACAHDAVLRRRVESLLTHSERLGDFLERPLVAPPDAEEGTDPWLGRRLGPYLLVELLGAGGMGQVYRALREEPFRMAVAVKVMHGFAGEEGRRRFEVEREVLAQLRHPRIASLLDGGSTADGTPYLVMELVEGVPITEHCDSRALPVSRRLALFVQVCEAVAAAHRQLVVHRDIKPSNVLVTAAESPYLLDFGIAKLLESEPGAGQPTRAGLRVLTPSYASPEQLVGAPVSTVSDVYSLGVLLFELLTGTVPRDPQQLAADLWVEPAAWREAPSASVAVMRSAAPPRCGLSGSALARLLRGDLDCILQRALRRRPEERYPSASELAADLDRYLAGQPVLARPRSTAYRAGKLLQRHPRAAAAAGAAFVALIGFTALSRYQLLAVQREKAAAEAARRESEQVTRLLLQSFEVASSPLPENGAATARRVVDQGVTRAEELAADPDLQASVRHALAAAYDQLGLYEESRRLFEQALAARRERLGGGHPATLATELASASPLRQLGQVGEAERRAREVLAARRRALGDADPSTAEATAELAAILLSKADVAEAEALATRSLSIHRAAAHPDHAAIVDDLHILGQAQYLGAHYELAERTFEEALHLLRRGGGTTTRAHGWLLVDLAGALERQARFSSAEPLFRQAIEQQERILGPAHPDVATFRDAFGILLQRQGELAPALAQYETALAIRRRVYGDEHPSVAESLGHKAQVLYAQGDAREAERLFRETLAIRRRTLPAEHPLIAETLNNLAVTLELEGHWLQAEALYREALGLHRRALGPAHPQVALALHNLAWAVWNRGDSAAAAEMFREAFSLCSAVATPPPPECAYDLDKLAWLSRRIDDLPAAERLARQALSTRRGALGNRHPETGQSRLQLAAVLAVAGRAQEARAEAEETAADFAGSFPADHWLLGYAQLVRGLSRATLGEPAGEQEADRGYELVARAWAAGSVPRTDAADLRALARRRLAATAPPSS